MEENIRFLKRRLEIEQKKYPGQILPEHLELAIRLTVDKDGQAPIEARHIGIKDLFDS